MLLIKAHELHDKKDTNNIHVHTPFWKVCLQLMLIFMWRQCEKIIKIHSYHETFFETFFLFFHTFTCSYFSSYQFNNTQSIFLIYFLHLYKLKINSPSLKNSITFHNLCVTQQHMQLRHDLACIKSSDIIFVESILLHQLSVCLFVH